MPHLIEGSESYQPEVEASKSDKRLRSYGHLKICMDFPFRGAHFPLKEGHIFPSPPARTLHELNPKCSGGHIIAKRAPHRRGTFCTQGGIFFGKDCLKGHTLQKVTTTGGLDPIQSAPGGAHFAESCPCRGTGPNLKCSRRGTFRGELPLQGH